ncbi:hypothetical protein [Leifsonia sp. Leaf264]|uniref:hypothetical protein n=1 Tax=Leifsonia sp. Leaf264 TaxID=1736314 RepID=UPI0006F502E0|nr:hypothetical protein [Leifsonia sp. Leaf264]KQO98379.1 hypothetical protein ASF30_09980 [Leifsonia sp. Leaf264]
MTRSDWSRHAPLLIFLGAAALVLVPVAAFLFTHIVASDRFVENGELTGSWSGIGAAEGQTIILNTDGTASIDNVIGWNFRGKHRSGAGVWERTSTDDTQVDITFDWIDGQLDPSDPTTISNLIIVIEPDPNTVKLVINVGDPDDQSTRREFVRSAGD